MSGRRLRVAVIGTGLMGRFHVAVARRNGAIVAAVADADILKARSLSHAAARSAKALSLDEIFEAGDLDAVHVCTPPETHFEITRRALARGMHVLCEKPVAGTSTEVEELLADAARRNRIVCPVHQFPFQHGVQRMIAARNRIGAVRHITAEICTAGGDGVPDAARHQVAVDILPHPLSLSRAFEAGPLADADWHVSSVFPGEFVVTGALRGTVGFSFLLSTRGRPTRNSLRVIGEEGTASFDLFHGFSILERGSVSRLRKLSRPFAESALTLGHATANGLRRTLERDTAFPGLRELVRRFYAAIAEGRPSPVPPEELVDISRARDRIISLFRD